MRKHLKLLTIVCCLLVCASGALMARSRSVDLPHRYQPSSQDRQLVQVENPVDGRIWSAWAFRSGDEYDIALAVADENGVWSEPMFLGRDDGRDQVDPAFVIHESGAVVVAYVDISAGQILLSAIAAGGQHWSRPLPVVAGADLRSPSMLILGDRLVLAFRAAERVEMVTIPLFGNPEPPVTSRGFTDGPDPTGATDGEKPEDSDSTDDDEDNEESTSRTGMVPIIDERRD
jgi:hypothetical protein